MRIKLVDGKYDGVTLIVPDDKETPIRKTLCAEAADFNRLDGTLALAIEKQWNAELHRLGLI